MTDCKRLTLPSVSLIRALVLAPALVFAVSLFGSAAPAEACELLHLKRWRPTPTPMNNMVNTLCWTGCPFKIAGEQDTGKGRWIIQKGEGEASVQQVIVLEKNQRTGIEYVKVKTRSTDFSCQTIPDPTLAARVAAATPFPPCNTPDFKVKFTKPRVCQDQTTSCPTNEQRSLKVFHDWDAVDDLERGIDVVRDGVLFSHSRNKTLNVWFEVCCGTVFNFGLPGDFLELDTYAVIRDTAGACRVEKLREGARNSGGPLPNPATAGTECQ